jgi:hypothetical protein
VLRRNRTQTLDARLDSLLLNSLVRSTGLESENRMYDANDNLIRREVHCYDSNSRIKETQFFDEKNVLRGNAVYEWADSELTINYFDLDGNLLEHPAA